MSVKTILWLIVFLSLGTVSLLWAARDGFELVRVGRVWDRGVVAPLASYQIDDVWAVGVPFMGYAGALMWFFDADLSYTTSHGEPQTARARFFRIGGAGQFTDNPYRDGEDTHFRGGEEPFFVRYLSDEPEKATVSWAYHALGSGWVFVVLMLLVALSSLSVVGRYLFSKSNVVIDLE